MYIIILYYSAVLYFSSVFDLNTSFTMHHGIRIPLHQSLYCCSSSQSSLIWVFFQMWGRRAPWSVPTRLISTERATAAAPSVSRRLSATAPVAIPASRPWRQDDWHVSHLSTGAARSRCEGGGGTWRKPPAVSGNLGTRGWGGGTEGPLLFLSLPDAT